MNRAISAAAEATNGTSPTAKTSCGETLVVRKSMMKGTTLTGMATSRQFKYNEFSCSAVL
jgi:hypothetical protein